MSLILKCLSECRNVSEYKNMNFAPYEQPYLKALPIIFAIVPINKESNNFASICKRYYVEII